MHTQSYSVLTNANITSTTATTTSGRSNSNSEKNTVGCSNIKYCGNDFSFVTKYSYSIKNQM